MLSRNSGGVAQMDVDIETACLRSRVVKLRARRTKPKERFVELTALGKMLAEEHRYLRQSARELGDVHRQRIAAVRGNISSGRFVFDAPRIEKQAPSVEGALADISRRLIEAQEQERARIARELHDDISQRLALLTIGMEEASHDLLSGSFSKGAHRLGELRQQVIGIAADIHTIAHELHSSSLEHLGFVPAVRRLAKEIGKRHAMQIEIKNDGVRGALSPEISLCLFRIVQEGLHNAAKHSGASSAQVRLQDNTDHIHLTLADAGKGFDVAAITNARGLGLASMRERIRLVNGRIEIQSQPTLGTRIQAWVPLQPLQSTPRC
jgi:signal transduction histidine kinase